MEQEKTEKSETIVINRKDHEALLNSVVRLQRKFEQLSRTLFRQANNLRPENEAPQYSPIVDFGGLCYLSAAAELHAVYYGILRLENPDDRDFDKNTLHHFSSF